MDYARHQNIQLLSFSFCSKNQCKPNYKTRRCNVHLDINMIAIGHIIHYLQSLYLLGSCLLIAKATPLLLKITNKLIQLSVHSCTPALSPSLSYQYYNFISPAVVYSNHRHHTEHTQNIHISRNYPPIVKATPVVVTYPDIVGYFTVK